MEMRLAESEHASHGASSKSLFADSIRRVIRTVVGGPVRSVRRLSRRCQLSREMAHVTRERLIEDLERLRLPADAVLLVHTSLKRLGYVEGGAKSVIEALIEVVVRRRGGTLAMPCYSLHGSMHATLASGRVFDVRSAPCNLGAIPEAFRRYPGVRRSVHPTHSIAALGYRADWITGNHHLCGSTFGEGSPMVRMMELDGLLAGLCTSLGTVTFYHCLEDLESDFPIEVYSANSPFRVSCLDWHGIPHELTISAHAPDQARTRIDRRENQAIRSFFTDTLERHAGLQWFSIGEGRSWIIRMRDMHAECARLMRAGVTIYSTADDLAARDLSGANSD
jgi:aminoglycoside 3-N-acetyltransferase